MTDTALPTTESATFEPLAPEDYDALDLILDDLRSRRSGPSRARVFTVRPRVLIDNQASSNYTVIEVNGRDRPGLLHDLTATLTTQQVQIATAKVSTFGERVVDVFYVKNIFGLKIHHEAQLAEIRDALITVLADPDAVEAPRPRRTRAAAE